MIKIIEKPMPTIMQQQTDYYDFIKLEEVIYISLEHSHTIIHLCNKRKIRSKEKLANYYRQLKEYNFYYANRYHIFNFQYLKNLYETKIQLHNGEELKLSRVKRKELLAKLKR